MNANSTGQKMRSKSDAAAMAIQTSRTVSMLGTYILDEENAKCL